MLSVLLFAGALHVDLDSLLGRLETGSRTAQSA